MIDTDKYDCPQEGCGRETIHVEEGYFECRCGWFGQRISRIEDLEKEVKRLRELADNLYDFAKWMQDEKRKDPIGLQVLKDRMYWRNEE